MRPLVDASCMNSLAINYGHAEYRWMQHQKQYDYTKSMKWLGIPFPWSFVKLIKVLHIQVLCSIALKGHMTHKAIIGDAWYCLFGSRTYVGLQHWHTTHTTSFVLWFEFCTLINNQVITLHTIQSSSKACIYFDVYQVPL